MTNKLTYKQGSLCKVNYVPLLTHYTISNLHHKNSCFYSFYSFIIKVQ